MKVLYQKRFLKDLASIPAKHRTQIESFVFAQLPQLNSIQEAEKIEKMTGYKYYYKVRFGQYRLGFTFKEDEIILQRVLHRKEIYKYFP